MRIMNVMGGARQGGAETYFTDLVTALHRAGVEQQVVIRRNPERARLLRDHGIEPIELPFGGLLDLTTRLRLRRIVAEFRPDVVQAWMNRAARFVPAGAYARIGWMGGYYDLKYYRGYDWLAVVTPDQASYVTKAGWSADRVRVLRVLAADTPAPPADRSALGTPEGAPLLLALARLHPKKGIDVLLNAMPLLPECHLWIAGEGPIRAELEALAAKLGLGDRVRFLGWRNDRAALLAACDVCVFPSRYEPFGAVTIEAWAHGRPLVAAAASGPAATITDGRNGLLVPIDDHAALAAAIRRVVDSPDLRDRLVENGRATYLAEFTEAKVVESYLNFYREVVASAGRRPGQARTSSSSS